MLAFFTILASAFCGLFGAPLWTVGLATALLFLIANLPRIPLYRRAYAVGGTAVSMQTMAGSAINGLMAAGGAYIFGAIYALIIPMPV